jgi:hypothetical protein
MVMFPLFFAIFAEVQFAAALALFLIVPVFVSAFAGPAKTIQTQKTTPSSHLMDRKLRGSHMEFSP